MTQGSNQLLEQSCQKKKAERTRQRWCLLETSNCLPVRRCNAELNSDLYPWKYVSFLVSKGSLAVVLLRDRKIDNILLRVLSKKWTTTQLLMGHADTTRRDRDYFLLFLGSFLLQREKKIFDSRRKFEEKYWKNCCDSKFFLLFITPV
jgi:hypothetical protein